MAFLNAKSSQHSPDEGTASPERDRWRQRGHESNPSAWCGGTTREAGEDNGDWCEVYRNTRKLTQHCWAVRSSYRISWQKSLGLSTTSRMPSKTYHSCPSLWQVSLLSSHFWRTQAPSNLPTEMGLHTSRPRCDITLQWSHCYYPRTWASVWRPILQSASWICINLSFIFRYGSFYSFIPIVGLHEPRYTNLSYLQDPHLN